MRATELDNVFTLLSSTELKNVQLAFELARGMGHPPEWQQRLDELLLIHNFFKRKKKEPDPKTICQLNNVK